LGIDWTLITAVATVLGVFGGLISVVFVVYESVYLKGCAASPDLTETEAMAFSNCVGMVMSMTYSAYVQHQQSLIDDEVWEAYLAAARNRLAKPGFLAAWQGLQMGYPTSFRAALTAILPEGGVG
jgi:hypothetical protein